MWTYIDKICKSICMNTLYNVFCIFDYLYHLTNNVIQPWIKQMYYREPKKEIQESQYYRIIDLLEEDVDGNKMYDTSEERIITNDTETLFPASIHNFSDEDIVYAKHDSYESRTMIDSIWIGKFQIESQTYYHCFTMWNNKRRDFDSIENYIVHGICPSNIEFLFIEYTHPKMNHTIELNVPKSFMICDNEIFSIGFIFYLLEKQNTTFIFDLDYHINILDSNVQKIELTSNDYLLLKENTYKTIHLEKYID